MIHNKISCYQLTPSNHWCHQPLVTMMIQLLILTNCSTCYSWFGKSMCLHFLLRTACFFLGESRCVLRTARELHVHFCYQNEFACDLVQTWEGILPQYHSELHFKTWLQNDVECRTCHVYGVVYTVVGAHRSMQACKDGSNEVDLFAAQCFRYIVEGEQKRQQQRQNIGIFLTRLPRCVTLGVSPEYCWDHLLE